MFEFRFVQESRKGLGFRVWGLGFRASYCFGEGIGGTGLRRLRSLGGFKGLWDLYFQTSAFASVPVCGCAVQGFDGIELEGICLVCKLWVFRLDQGRGRFSALRKDWATARVLGWGEKAIESRKSISAIPPAHTPEPGVNGSVGRPRFGFAGTSGLRFAR